MMKNHASWLLISIHDCWEWEQIPVPNVQKLIGWAAIKSLMKPSWSANNGKLPSIADFWWLQLILCDAWCLLYSCIVTAKVDILHFSDCFFVNQLSICRLQYTSGRWYIMEKRFLLGIGYACFPFDALWKLFSRSDLIRFSFQFRVRLVYDSMAGGPNGDELKWNFSEG